MRGLPVLISAFLLAGAPALAHDPAVDRNLATDVSVIPKPAPGSNEVLRSKVRIADGLEVIIADVVIAPNTTVPPHYHPGEEFIYVLEGTSMHVEEGQPERVISAGEAFVIPPMAPHAPRGGPEGARAIAFRLHIVDQPERIPVEKVNSLPAQE